MLIGLYNNYKEYHNDAKYCLDTVCKQIRKVIPNAKVVQQSNFREAVNNAMLYVDEVWVMEDTGSFTKNRVAHHIKALEEDDEYLAIDTDVIVQTDITDWFKHDYTVSTTYRPHMRATETQERCPGLYYNHGVIFSKNVVSGQRGESSAVHFWKEVFDKWPEGEDDWLGAQTTFYNVIEPWEGNKYKFQILPDCYNYSPVHNKESTKYHFAVHYKGNTRKPWFVDHCHRLNEQKNVSYMPKK